MMDDFTLLSQQAETVLCELITLGEVKPGQVVVIGCSTSEVAGQRIGTSGGSEPIARAIFQAIERVRLQCFFHMAFQCCEHLNRALVVERAAMEKFGWEEVSVVPVAHAGGSMAGYAYRHLSDACVVESIRAHAGLDIGDTLIGMHLREVAVPVRPSIRTIGSAHITMARTRPKLIGGNRAVYVLDEPPQHT